MNEVDKELQFSQLQSIKLFLKFVTVSQNYAKCIAKAIKSCSIYCKIIKLKLFSLPVWRFWINQTRHIFSFSHKKEILFIMLCSNLIWYIRLQRLVWFYMFIARIFIFWCYLLHSQKYQINWIFCPSKNQANYLLHYEENKFYNLHSNWQFFHFLKLSRPIPSNNRLLI